ncbi:lymphocyte antigen 6D [Otolemur garnettii]|uniref:Lymphocyte antigen 6 family member D n=1 Tax=Otolemur garnettii TaxID=30611 RepID=H0XZ56_OTOGA|nr:lymphocyte antigen 6D [Otolemur garnettii]
MKAILLLFAALAVAVGPARALRCHVCVSSTDCKHPQECSPSSNFCKTITTVESLSGNLVKKECTEKCVPIQTQQGQLSSSTAIQCCQGDLCNERQTSAAPARAPLSHTILSLGLAWGLLALLLAPNL